MIRRYYAIISILLNCFFIVLFIGVIATGFVFKSWHHSVKRLSSHEVVFESDVATLISDQNGFICHINVGEQSIAVCKNEIARSMSVDVGGLDFFLSHQYDGYGTVTNLFYRERKASTVSQYRLISSVGDAQ